MVDGPGARFGGATSTGASRPSGARGLSIANADCPLCLNEPNRGLPSLWATIAGSSRISLGAVATSPFVPARHPADVTAGSSSCLAQTTRGLTGGSWFSDMGNSELERGELPCIGLQPLR